MKSNPSAGALRAAEAIARRCTIHTTHGQACRDFAEFIDRETHLPELIRALREIDETLKGNLPITAQVKEIAKSALKLVAT